MIRSRCSRTNRRRSAGEALSSRVKGARSDQIELKFSPQPHLRVSKPGPDISALHLQLREPSPVEFAGLCQAEPEFVAECFRRPLWGAGRRAPRAAPSRRPGLERLFGGAWERRPARCGWAETGGP